MMPHLMFSEREILAFALVLLRVSAFMLSWPIFSVYNVPGPARILTSVTVAMILFPVVNKTGLMTAHAFDENLVWLAGKEVLTGLCLGFMTRLFFFAVSVGGNLIATSTGLANAQLFNPTMGATTTTVEQFYSILATLIFLSLNGHHYFLTGLAQSFDAIPLSLGGTEFALVQSKFKDSGLILQLVTEAGIKISAPVLVAIFMLNVVMGVLGRAVPQINVFVTSMPVNYMAGILVMLISIPALVFELDHQLLQFIEYLFKFMTTI